jgi:hypothetical protein
MDSTGWYIFDLVLCVAGGLAICAASYIKRGESARAAVRIGMMPGGNLILQWYVILAFPLAFANGYLLRQSWLDCVIVGAGTWLCMMVSIALTRRFNAVFQFFLFSGITVLWLITDVVRLLMDRGGG